MTDVLEHLFRFKPSIELQQILEPKVAEELEQELLERYPNAEIAAKEHIFSVVKFYIEKDLPIGDVSILTSILAKNNKFSIVRKLIEKRKDNYQIAIGLYKNCNTQVLLEELYTKSLCPGVLRLLIHNLAKFGGKSNEILYLVDKYQDLYGKLDVSYILLDAIEYENPVWKKLLNYHINLPFIISKVRRKFPKYLKYIK